MRNCDTFETLKQHPTDQIKNVEWLQSFLAPHCKIKRLRKRAGRLRIIQIPNEFARFLVFMANNNVSSYLEIGVSTGGSWFFAHQYLKATVPAFSKSRGYDQTSKLRDPEQMFAAFPEAEFVHMNSKNIKLGDERWDMSFIDARHTKRWAMRDFEKVRRNSKFVAFHDIVLEGSTVGEAWSEIKSGLEHWEFIDENIPSHAQCGIGVVKI